MAADHQRVIHHAADVLLVHAGAVRLVFRRYQAAVEHAAIERSHVELADEHRLVDALQHGPLGRHHLRSVDVKAHHVAEFAAGFHGFTRATEFGGFAMPPVPGAPPPVTPAGGRAGANAAAFGPAIIKYLESKGISWTVWCFDPEWGPTLISNWEYQLNPSGEFAKLAMHGEVK